MKTILSGNEAVARGAWEAGCRVATAYPGTPSTEILENITQYPDIYCEWSINEKVALEVAAGSAFTGSRTLVAMKHVGLNVAADPMFTMGYSSVSGGFLIVTADDPGMWSSQNEQDNRHYSRHAKIPMLEPSDSQEIKDLIGIGFELSEKFKTPFLIRLTTRTCHSSGVVELEDRVNAAPPAYAKDAKQRLFLPSHARVRHVAVEERLNELEAFGSSFAFNRVEWNDRSLGIVAAGIGYQYAREVFPNASFLKLALTYPLPKQLIRDFAAGVKELIVIEEGDPVMEVEIRAMGIPVTAGKDRIPLCGELDPKTVRKNLSRSAPAKQPLPGIPSRPPVLCPGCPHRSVFYAINRLKLVATGDIGCYTLGAYPPLSAMDTCICMGASVTISHGMEKSMNGDFSKKLVAVIGDSTFFHSGITGLVNSVYNRGRLNLIILDNLTTAMTGHQPHPGTGALARGEAGKRIPLEDIVKGCGVEFMKVIDPYRMKETEEAIKEALVYDGVAVIISRRACALQAKPDPSLVVDRDVCNGCRICLKIGCPAISLAPAGKDEKPKPVIDRSLCFGCRMCWQVCPKKAMK